VQAEAAEERRARERCHVETIRAGEKLRLARSQGNQLRERVRALEEVELRYPSRHRREGTGAGQADTAAQALAPHLPVSPSSSPRPRMTSCSDLQGPQRLDSRGGGALDVRDFVAHEEERLAALEASPSLQRASSEERPRAMPPAQARLLPAGGSTASREIVALEAAEVQGFQQPPKPASPPQPPAGAGGAAGPQQGLGPKPFGAAVTAGYGGA